MSSGLYRTRPRDVILNSKTGRKVEQLAVGPRAIAGRTIWWLQGSFSNVSPGSQDLCCESSDGRSGSSPWRNRLGRGTRYLCGTRGFEDFVSSNAGAVLAVQEQSESHYPVWCHLRHLQSCSFFELIHFPHVHVAMWWMKGSFPSLFWGPWPRLVLPCGYTLVLAERVPPVGSFVKAFHPPSWAKKVTSPRRVAGQGVGVLAPGVRKTWCRKSYSCWMKLRRLTWISLTLSSPCAPQAQVHGRKTSVALEKTCTMTQVCAWRFWDLEAMFSRWTSIHHTLESFG